MRNHPDNPSHIEAAREEFEAAVDLAKNGKIRGNTPWNNSLLWVTIREYMGRATDSLRAHAKERFEIDE
jgi:hypothetical protein